MQNCKSLFRCASRFSLCRFVWVKIAKLYNAITLVVIGVFGQFKKFCNGLEKEKRMIEIFNVTTHQYLFNSPQQFTSSIHRYISLLQVTATNHRYISPLQFTATPHLFNSSLQLTASTYLYNLRAYRFKSPTNFSATINC